MVKRCRDLTGETFGFWSVLSEGEPKKDRRKWICRCVCGNLENVEQASLLHKRSISCGCDGTTDIERFFSFVKKTDTCWIWQGNTYSWKGKENGYGRFRVFGKLFKSHRYSWILHFGSIPKGLYVCHKCDNPSCVNPDHLWLGTCLDNCKDKVSKGRCNARNGEKINTVKLNENDVRKIRRDYEFENLRSLSEKYGVDLCTIRRIANKKTWKHVI